MTPATARDIKLALGPDASGLGLTQDLLPDLFTLTSSRIEESPKQFTLEQPYHSGRWEGGKAVIEYARDLSYTIVSIYDKDGHRQRIYSVKTDTDHSAGGRTEEEPQARTSDTGVNTSEEAPASSESPARSRRSAQAGRRTEGGAEISYEWDDARGAYVPVAASRGSYSEEAAPASRNVSASASPQRESAPPQSSHTRRRRHHTETVVASSHVTTRSSESGTTAQKPSSLPAPMQDAGVWIPSGAKTKSAAQKEATAQVSKVKAGNTTWVERRNTSDVEEAAAPSRKSGVKGSEPKSTRTAAATQTRNIDEWVPPPTQKTPTRSHRTESAGSGSEEQVPTTEELLANADTKTGPDNSGGDSWVPKSTPKTAVVDLDTPPPPEEPVKVASLPKSRPVDNSVDNMLKMANEGKEAMPGDGDKWVPQKTSLPAPDMDLNSEISRVRQQEKKQAAVVKAQPQIRRDVNNPEEGVLPVSSFEKFSGPMYGRHREYERHFNPGKRPSVSVLHDFYVDEVDRKKEVHNIYYYQHLKGKVPKLVAVERHEKVSFRSNYDIEKEDTGSISQYN